MPIKTFIFKSNMYFWEALHIGGNIEQRKLISIAKIKIRNMKLHIFVGYLFGKIKSVNSSLFSSLISGFHPTLNSTFMCLQKIFGNNYEQKNIESLKAYLTFNSKRLCAHFFSFSDVTFESQVNMQERILKGPQIKHA